MRRASAKRTIALPAVTALLGIALRTYILLHIFRPLGDDMAVAYFQSLYYPTYTRLDGLLVGVASAIVRIFQPQWWSVAAGKGHATLLAGIALLAIAMWLFAGRMDSTRGVAAWGTILGFPILSLGIGLCVLSSLSRNGLLARVTVPGARTLAALAYCLYLSHKVIVHLDRTYLSALTSGRHWRATFIYAVSCLAVAATLHLSVERPFLRLRDQADHPRAAIVEQQMQDEPAL